MRKLKNIFKKGDTIIEVTFSIVVFSLISVLSIQIMDRDLAKIQATLEYEMARNEIDAQAEALRFIHNAYLSERELAESTKNGATLYREYSPLWQKLSRTDVKAKFSGLANFPYKISQFTSVDCRTYYEQEEGDIHRISNDKAFVINTRKIDPTNVDETIVQSAGIGNTLSDKFAATEIYPRIIFSTEDGAENDEATLTEANVGNLLGGERPVYDKVARAEGIWVISARDYHKGDADDPEFFDFHIRTCWFAPGHDRPSTIATTIRLYNPEYVEGQQYGNK